MKSKKKGIRVFEAFAGIGAQMMALKLTKTPCKVGSSAISEWYIDAILAYWKIHHKAKIKEENPGTEEMIEQFTRLGLSKNSKTPWMPTEKEIVKDRQKYISLYNANKVCKNIGSIKNHLKTFEKEIPEYLQDLDVFTYSFPCQDISTAGKMKGLEEGTGTHSSLLWEVKSLLSMLKERGVKLPKMLVMENVKVVTSSRFSVGLEKFKSFLDELGYENVQQSLNAKHYGSMQDRKRFFMISLLRESNEGDAKIAAESLKKAIENKQVRENNGKVKTLRKIVKEIYDLPKSPKNSEYEDQLNEIYGGANKSKKDKKSALKIKTDLLDRAYPSFYQARIAVGLDCDTVPTITFKGEFSRIRVFDIKDGSFVVRRLSGRENWLLMGFSSHNYKKIKDLCNKSKSEDMISGLAGNSIPLEPLRAIFKAATELRLING